MNKRMYAYVAKQASSLLLVALAIVGGVVSSVAHAAWTATDVPGVSVTPVGPHPLGIFVYTPLRGAAVLNKEADTQWLVNLDSGDLAATTQWNIGIQPKAIALNPSGSELWVADDDGRRLLRFSVTRRSLLETIPLSFVPTALTFNGDGSRLFVASDDRIRILSTTNRTLMATVTLEDIKAVGFWSAANRAIAIDGRNLYVINPVSAAVETTVPVGSGLVGLAIDPASATAYVADAHTNAVAAVDLNARTYRGRHALPDEPAGIAFDPMHTRVLVTLKKLGQLASLNPATASQPSVFLGEKLTAIAVDNKADKAVALSDKEKAFIVNLADRVSAQVALPGKPSAVGVDESRHLALVGLNKQLGLRFLDLTTQALLADVVAFGSQARAIAVDSSRGLAVVVVRRKDQLLLVDITNRRLLATLAVPGEFTSAAIHRPRGVAYVVNHAKSTGEVLILDLATRAIIGSIAVSKDAESIVVDEQLDLAVVAIEEKNKLEVIDLKTNQIIATHALTKHPRRMALNPVTHTVVVTAKDSDQIALLDLTAQTLTPNFATLDKPIEVDVTVRFNQALVLAAEKGEIEFLQLPNPVSILTEIVPPDVTAPSPAVALLAIGKNFLDAVPGCAPTAAIGCTGSKVYLDNTPLVTRWKDNEHLEADVPVEVLKTAGIYSIKVVTPAPGGGESQSLNFTVQNPVPVLATISPTEIVEGGGNRVLAVTGNRFVTTSVARFGAQNLVTTFVDSQHLTAIIPAALLTNAGAVPVTVFNPIPGGGSSNAITLNVTPSGPRITSVEPASGEAGTLISIKGSGFDPIATQNQVSFTGNVAATVQTATTTELRLTVPPGAQTGPIKLTTPKGTALSPTFTVILEQDFALVASPAQTNLVQNASTTFTVQLSSLGTKPFTSLVRLSARGLPSGVTAQFAPPTITANQTVALTLKSLGATPPQTFGFDIVGDFTLNGVAFSRLVAANVTIVQGGQTGVKGRFVTPEGVGIGAVYVRHDTFETTSDAAGNFTLLGLPAGKITLRMDATPANSLYPIWPVSLTLEANKVLILEDWVLIPPPSDDKFKAISNATQTQVIADTRYPGLEIILPAGVTITGWDGVVKSRIAVEKVEPEKMGLPPPPFPMKEAYQLFFGTPMGGIPSAPIPMRFPNVAELEPGQKTDIWFYDGSPMGGSGEWKKAGQGTVSADGKTVLTDPGAGIPRFCGKCGFAAISCPPPPLPPPPSCPDKKAGKPIDLYSGQEMLTTSGLRCGGLTPVETGWSYNPVDAFGGRAGTIASFGFGWTFDYDIALLPFTGVQKRLILPGGIAVNFVDDGSGVYRPAEGQRMPGAVMVASNAGANEWDVKFKDGRIWRFKPFPGIPGVIRGGPPTFITEIVEPAGAVVNVTRQSDGRIIALGSPTRNVRMTYGTNGFVSELKDSANRAMNFTYTATGRLQTMTDVSGSITRYTYVDDSEIAPDSACASDQSTMGERIKTVQYPGQTTVTENFYGAGRRTLRQTGPVGEYKFAYKLTGACVTHASSPGIKCSGPSCPDTDSWENHQAGWRIHGGQVVTTTVSDPRGNTRSYTFNSKGATLSTVGALGERTQYRLNANSRVVQSTDVLGRVTRYGYDDAGNQIFVVDAENRLTEYDYDPKWNMVTHVRRSLTADTKLTVARFTYDARTGNIASRTDGNNKTWTYNYNSRGQPDNVIGPTQTVTRFTYNDAGDLIAITDPLGNVRRLTPDAVGRVIETVDGLGYVTSLSLNARGQPERVTDAAQGVVRLEYDIRGNLARITNQNNQLIEQNSYDDGDRLITRTDGVGKTETLTYDAAGNISSYRDQKGQTRSFAYDENDRLVQVVYSDGNRETRSYDTVGRLTSVTSRTGTISYQYDLLDRVTQVTTSQGSIKYAYDVLDRRIRMETPYQVTTYSYDNADNLTTITQGTELTTIEYDENGRRSKLAYPNGITANYVYDDAGRLTNLTYRRGSTIIEQLTNDYDGNGNVIQRSKSATNSKQESPKNATFDPQTNRLLSLNGELFSYDDNGNLTTRSNSCGTTAYSWDVRNRLTSIAGFTSDCSPLTAVFNYDAYGRRVEKTVNGATVSYLYDGGDVVAEIGNDPTIYLRTTSIDEAVARYSQSGDRYLLADMLGSTQILTDRQGEVTSTYSYSPFGETNQSGQPDANSIQYTGRENDQSGLYYYRARYYAPDLARFISSDPVGLAAGLNVYSYVGNSPLMFVDPSGLTTVYRGPNNNYSDIRPPGPCLKAVWGGGGTYIKGWEPCDPPNDPNCPGSGGPGAGGPGSGGPGAGGPGSGGPGAGGPGAGGPGSGGPGAGGPGSGGPEQKPWWTIFGPSGDPQKDLESAQCSLKALLGFGAEEVVLTGVEKTGRVPGGLIKTARGGFIAGQAYQQWQCAQIKLR